MLLLLLACHAPGPRPGDTAIDPTDSARPDSPPPARLALPYATVGERPEAPLATRAEVEVADGDLEVVPDADGVIVRWAGPIDAPALIDAALDVGGAHVEVTGVIGDLQLGEVQWTADAWGRRALVRLPSAPNAGGATGWTDDRALIAIPPSFTGADDVSVVTHLHGFYATISATAADQALRELVADSGRDVVLVAPQGPVEAASGDFGNLMGPGGHARLVRDVVTLLYREGLTTAPRPAAQALTAHSGGYQAAAAIVRQGGLPIASVHLLDALYAEVDTFDAFARAGVLRSNTTAAGGTTARNDELAARLAAAGQPASTDPSDAALAASRTSILRSDATHDRCMRDDRTLARWLAWSGLPAGPDAAPALRSVIAEGASARVRWLGAGPTTLEGSDDGHAWRRLGEVDGDEALAPAAAWLRITQAIDGRASGASDTYAVTRGDGPRWLVVDGFDRVLGGSFHAPRHDHAARVAQALGAPCDAAHHEAVARGEVDLGGYAGLVWLLGDEGTADHTFDEQERALLTGWVAGGGRLIVSGAEVGYATDPAWLAAALGATFVADDAGTTALEDGRTFGHAYDEDYPDVLAGDRVVWRYAGGAVAAVSDGRAVVVGFPVETFTDGDLPGALAQLRGALDP